MCGICGWVDFEGRADPKVVGAMAETLAHRGPDGAASWRDPDGVAAIAHRRLAVLDTSDRAEQPMVHSSGAVLSYNGEVYNFRELRRELEAEGHAFRSDGDTEVVLAALVHWGVEALHRFNGMFAVALWQLRERRLLLARDRVGIKPLFWTRTGRGIAFGSELQALFEHPEVGRDLDGDACAAWLQSGYLGGVRTLLRGIERVPPGTLVEVDERGARSTRWYDPLEAVGRRDRLESAAVEEELEALLRDAVRMRLVSDVPLGCFLSSGVDSTAVVSAAVAAKAKPELLTVNFADGEDESAGAARAAAAFGLELRRASCTAEQMLEVIPAWPRISADPVADPSMLPTHLISGEARKSWTVALSGDGGDELLNGYNRLRFMPQLLRVPRSAWPAIRLAGQLFPARRWAAKLRSALAADGDWGAYQALHGMWPMREAAALLGRSELPLPWPDQLLRRLDGLAVQHRFRTLDLLDFLPERVLAKVDRASMAHSLEVRVPLLDHRIVELLLAAPGKLVAGKKMLREVISRLGGPPPSAAKRGFEVPLDHWLRGPLKEAVRADLFGSTADHLGLDRERLRSTWQDHQSGRVDVAERLFAVVVLVRWADRWL